MKNSSDTIANQTRDLPAYSAAPQPTSPPRGPEKMKKNGIFLHRFPECIKNDHGVDGVWNKIK
jgi:hypothetical protein